MSTKEITTIDAYIKTFPKDTQEILKKLRKTIKSALPKDATEGISYRIPTFYLGGKYLVYFAGFEHHVSVYPATTAAVDQVERLSEYKVSKGTLKFPLDKPIPFTKIKKFVCLRVKEYQESLKT